MVGHEIEVILRGLGISDGPDAVRAKAVHALRGHGDLASGFSRLQTLAQVRVASVDVSAEAPTSELGSGGPSLADLESTLRALGPWKKGPFLLSAPGEGQILIDSEWRSELKWRRILDLGVSLSGKRVLDVGTGNGYFLFRLQGAGVHLAVGLEPSLRSLVQFLALRGFFPAPGRALWPLRLEELPHDFGQYDTVMSMGVLYHQRDPAEHLERLRRLIAPGGELILETLVVQSAQPLRLGPGQRYAGMRNVHVIPSIAALRSWLEQAGFEILNEGPLSVTTSLEQRTTAWAPGPSLSDVLQPGADDPGRPTREGHPRPTRLALLATTSRLARHGRRGGDADQ